MDVQAFEHLVNPLGLVPMVIEDDNFAPYQRGQVAGFPPEEAARLFERQSAVPVGENGAPVIPAWAPQDVGLNQSAVSNVEIPDNWRDLHHLQQIRIAKDLLGLTQGDRVPMDVAQQAIEAELNRRGAANGNQV